MIIQCKNPDLYRDWISYYEKYCPHLSPPEQRTMAFFNSQKGLIPYG